VGKVEFELAGDEVDDVREVAGGTEAAVCSATMGIAGARFWGYLIWRACSWWFGCWLFGKDWSRAECETSEGVVRKN
jgi:hypothetical protein